MTPSREVLRIDPPALLRGMEQVLKDQIFRRMKRRGVVVGLSRGIDSSVTTALCARILGSERVVALLIPEHESENESTHLGLPLAEQLKVKSIVGEIGPLLVAAGCHRRRDEAIRTQIPE